jgi:hypothetical protein
MDIPIPVKASYAEVRYAQPQTAFKAVYNSIHKSNILLAQNGFTPEPDSNWRSDFVEQQSTDASQTIDLDTRPKMQGFQTTPSKPRAQAQMLFYISNHGQISFLTLTGDWKEESPQHGPGTSLKRIFTLKDNPSVSTALFYRGSRIKKPAAQAFHELLAKPSHMLSPEELSSIAEVLEITTPINNKNFELMFSSTQLIGGKMVLIIEGHTKSSLPSMSTFAMYVDSDNSGQAVQEIYFRCPTSIYKQFVKGKDHPFTQIRWK